MENEQKTEAPKTELHKYVYAIVGNGTVYMLADKIIYKPDIFQLYLDGQLVGAFNYNHSLVRPDAIVNMQQANDNTEEPVVE